ncbi:MAG: cation transporter [Eubacteriales bacterium]|nr:cation transporter [Eubacteriales bacterium]
MKKTFQLTELDCASCADRMETTIRRLPGVTGANINFVTQKLTLEAEDADFDTALNRVRQVIHRISHSTEIL